MEELYEVGGVCEVVVVEYFDKARRSVRKGNLIGIFNYYYKC